MSWSPFSWVFKSVSSALWGNGFAPNDDFPLGADSQEWEKYSFLELQEKVQMLDVSACFPACGGGISPRSFSFTCICAAKSPAVGSFAQFLWCIRRTRVRCVCELCGYGNVRIAHLKHSRRADLRMRPRYPLRLVWPIGTVIRMQNAAFCMFMCAIISRFMCFAALVRLLCVTVHICGLWTRRSWPKLCDTMLM